MTRRTTTPTPPTLAHPALRRSKHETRPIERCPYCGDPNVIKKGIRKNKYGAVQLFFCRRCAKKFSPLVTKGRRFPLKVIIAAINEYRRGTSLKAAAEGVAKRYGIPVSRQNLTNWLGDFAEYLPVARIEDAINDALPPRNRLLEHRLLHGQVYEFKYHRAKAEIIVRESAHRAFRPLLDYFESVPRETPDALFRDEKARASSQKHALRFPVDGVHFAPKENAAKKMAQFVLQSVGSNKRRHETLQEFMLLNDSATVAVEVPIVLTDFDIAHFREKLGFALPLPAPASGAITGHIDFVQLRGGMIHILDYKPGAKNDKPIEQLTIYALALSRRTGIRLFHFKCAWFDGEHYYEFFPLHVVHKPGRSVQALPKSARPPLSVFKKTPTQRAWRRAS